MNDARPTISDLTKHVAADLCGEMVRVGGPLTKSATNIPKLLLQLAESIEEVEPVLTHTVPWYPTRWTRGIPERAKKENWASGLEKALLDAVNVVHQQSDVVDGISWLSRKAVFGIDTSTSPLPLFIATMAWGTGTAGYGWWRATDIAHRAGSVDVLLDRLRRQIRAAREGTSPGEQADAAWRAWKESAKLARLDTAFVSKLAYFAGNTEGRGPLIADRRTAWAAWAFSEDLGYTRTRRDRFVQYVKRLNSSGR